MLSLTKADSSLEERGGSTVVHPPSKLCGDFGEEVLKMLNQLSLDSMEDKLSHGCLLVLQ